MKINLHENRWTVLVEDLDFAKITQDEVNELACYLATNTLVVVKNQGHLTIHDERRAVGMFGDVENFNAFGDIAPFKYFIIPDTNGEICRVTGELDEQGNPGVFGHVSDLDWHCNQAGMPTRKPLVWLLGVKGTAGSRTSWTNNILAYQDIDTETKNQIKDLKLICGWKRGNYSEFNFGKDEDFNEYYTPSLVHTNNGDQTGLFFPFLQFRNFVGMSTEDSVELSNKLRDHILQEKYIYHHDWQDGDVVITEQWLGLHKRWKFDSIDKRLLHRMAMDFSKSDLSRIKNK